MKNGFIVFSYVLVFFAFCFAINGCKNTKGEKRENIVIQSKTVNTSQQTQTFVPDTNLYNARLLYLVHNKHTNKWPVKTGYPLPGAILPFKRIVAFYGNFYNPKMGILGEYPPDTMLRKLQEQARAWALADTMIPVQPALHYIAVSAQLEPGKGRRYRLRMPSTQIEKAIALARKINGIVFLDVQVGHSTVQEEIPLLEPYLKLPEVHLALDPEFSMKDGSRPGRKIGTMDAEDVNYAAKYLADIVKKNKLPPKILVVHRFTYKMLTNAKNIKTLPEVQIVINMDGFGGPAKKADSYKIIAKEPVQFTGFKIFYKQDVSTTNRKIMQPADVLKLNPSPIYIQYQ